MDHLDLLATLASAAPSVPTRVPLGARDCNTDYYSLDTTYYPSIPEYNDRYFSTYRGNENIGIYNDNSSYDIGSYVPIYSVNSGSDDHTSDPTAGVSGYKRPASPTSLLGNSPKRAHFDNSYVNWSSPPVPTLSTTTRPPGVSSAPPAPVKRGPGRPRKSPVPTQIQIPAPVAPASQPPPEAPGEIKIKQDVVSTKGWWTVNELSAFYEFCLGQDADAVFKKITLSSNKCWAPFVGKVGITRDAKQMKNQWETSLAMYKKLVPLLKITGGGADGDQHPDWEDKSSVTEFLQQRAGSGHDVDGLAAAKVKMWLTNGWYDLFHSRYNENPKADREVPRSSAEGLSDMEADLHADDDNTDASDDDIIVVEKPKASSTPVSSSIKNIKKGATDPRDVKPSTWSRSKPAPHTHSAKVKKEERLSSLSSYLEGRTQVDKEVMKIAREDANFKRLKSAEGTAKEIVADDTGKYSEEARTKANLVLERLMDAALGL